MLFRSPPLNRILPPLREARAVIMFNGGLNNMFSKLETMVFLKIAERSKTGEITFRFDKVGVTPKTFVAKVDSLEDDDIGRRRRKKEKYAIADRAHWPEFYAEHKIDMDALWNIGKKRLFEIDTGVVPDSEDSLEEADDDDDD